MKKTRVNGQLKEKRRKEKSQVKFSTTKLQGDPGPSHMISFPRLLGSCVVLEERMSKNKNMDGGVPHQSPTGGLSLVLFAIYTHFMSMEPRHL